MKLPNVKLLFQTIAVTSVLIMVMPKIASSVSMQFSTQNGAKQVSSTVTEVDSSKLIEVSDTIENTDFGNKNEVDELVDKVLALGNETVEQNENLKDFQKASLVRVVDGDTIVVDVYGDKCGKREHEYTVRLIGVDTPESVASDEYLRKTGKQNSEDGKEASRYTSSLLNNYDFVYLESDKQDEDKYGRLLRYVWIENPTNTLDITEISTEMLNGILIKEGYAEVATYYPNDKYEDYFNQIQEEPDIDV